MKKETEIEVKKELFRFYGISAESEGDFLFKVELLLENAVLPADQKYAVNLMELWNIYMTEYPFDGIVLDYYKQCCHVLKHLHDGRIEKFQSVKLMQRAALKNFMKYQMIQGHTDKKELKQLCYQALENSGNRNYLYQDIQEIFAEYFPSGRITQECTAFVHNFYDGTDKPFRMITERLGRKAAKDAQSLDVRLQFAESFAVTKEDMPRFQTQLNILLCRTALSDGYLRFSDYLKEQWEKLFPYLAYSNAVSTFVEKHEKAYLAAYCHGIRNMKNIQALRMLYQDSVVLCTALDAALQNREPQIRDAKELIQKENCTPPAGIEEEYRRMKNGFDTEILISHQDDIEEFHSLLVSRLGQKPAGKRDTREESRLDIQTAKLIGKEQEISELNKKIEKISAQASDAGRQALTDFIRQFDSQKYGHVLGKLYRIAYTEDAVTVAETKRVINNFFEILRLYGIEPFGELNAPVPQEEIEQDSYRLDNVLGGAAAVRYPGYRLGTDVILKPVAEEE